MAQFVDSLYNPYIPNKWLTYNDVLLLPSKSPFNSRNDSEISLATELTNNLRLDIPIISANMDTVTGAEMSSAMLENGGLGILHRFYKSDEEYYNAIAASVPLKPTKTNQSQIAFSVGCDAKWPGFTKSTIGGLNVFTKQITNFVVCLDVAHGHMQQAINTVKEFKILKAEFAKDGIIMHIIAGNVVTPMGVRDLAEAGADVVKIGVGPGCFTPETIITTFNGPKSIKDIKIGDFVLTHRGNYKEVIDLPRREEKEEIVNIKINSENIVKCTKNHEIYVLQKKYENIVNDNNIDTYAEWIPAENLNTDYFLLEVVSKI